MKTWRHLQGADPALPDIWEDAFLRARSRLEKGSEAERLYGLHVPLSREAPGIIEAARQTGTTIWLDGTGTLSRPQPPATWQKENRDGLVFISTSGTSGKPKWVRYTWQGLWDAAGRLEGTPAACGKGFLSPLPLHHVSGLLPWLRARMMGTACRLLLTADPEEDFNDWWISIVPTQLYRILHGAKPLDCWQCLGGIFVGGAPLPADLAAKARLNRLRLAPCYGMTETGAMISALWPEDFLSGKEGVGGPLRGIQMRLIAEGTIEVGGRGLFCGYDWQERGSPLHPTEDLGWWKPGVGWILKGRADGVLNSGGEKFAPQLLREAALSLPGVLNAEVCTHKDPEWGQRAMLKVALAPECPLRTLESFREALRPLLPRAALPVGLEIET